MKKINQDEEEDHKVESEIHEETTNEETMNKEIMNEKAMKEKVTKEEEDRTVDQEKRIQKLKQSL